MSGGRLEKAAFSEAGWEEFLDEWCVCVFSVFSRQSTDRRPYGSTLKYYYGAVNQMVGADVPSSFLLKTYLGCAICFACRYIVVIDLFET